MGEVRKRLPDKPEKPRVTLRDSALGFYCTGCLYYPLRTGTCAEAGRIDLCMALFSGAKTDRIFVLKEDKSSTS